MTTEEELQKKYDALYEKTLLMRKYQKAYLQYKASVDLNNAKVMQREVDKLIKKEFDLRVSQQQSLFQK